MNGNAGQTSSAWRSVASSRSRLPSRSVAVTDPSRSRSHFALTAVRCVTRPSASRRTAWPSGVSCAAQRVPRPKDLPEIDAKAIVKTVGSATKQFAKTSKKVSKDLEREGDQAERIGKTSRCAVGTDKLTVTFTLRAATDADAIRFAGRAFASRARPGRAGVAVQGTRDARNRVRQAAGSATAADAEFPFSIVVRCEAPSIAPEACADPSELEPRSWGWEKVERFRRDAVSRRAGCPGSRVQAKGGSGTRQTTERPPGW